MTVKLREPPFITATRQAPLGAPSASVAEIYAVARRLLNIWWQRQSRPRLRLLGVSLSGFDRRPQEDMFAMGSKGAATDQVQDRINLRFGTGSLVRGGILRTHKRD